MKTEIKISDFMFLIEAVLNVFINEEANKIIEKSPDNMLKIIFSQDESFLREKLEPAIENFKYYQLLEDAEKLITSDTPYDILKHPIDEFMVDVYRTLLKMDQMIKDLEERVGDAFFFENKMGDEKKTNEIKHSLKSEYKKLKKLFNDIMLDCEFSYCEISGIQKNYLNDMLNEAIENEDYEIAAKVRDRIKNFT